MEVPSDSAKNLKPRVLFLGLKLFGSKSLSPKVPIETSSKEKKITTTLNLLTTESSEFKLKDESCSGNIKDHESIILCMKNKPSDNVKHYDGDVSVMDIPWLPETNGNGLVGSSPSSTRDKLGDTLPNKISNDHNIKKEYFVKDKQRDSIVTTFSSLSSKSCVNKNKRDSSLKKKVKLYDNAAITNKSNKGRLKLVPGNSDDEITVLHSDFPVKLKQFNCFIKRKACEPANRDLKLQIKAESTSPDRYANKYESSADVNLRDRFMKINTCKANAGTSPEGSCNTLNNELCRVKLKEIDQVYVKEEPCDQRLEGDDGNDGGIHSPLWSDLSSNAAPKIEVFVKEEPNDQLLEVNDGNDSGISCNVDPKVEPSESPIEKELCETSQNFLKDEPWLPWLPLDTSENEKLKASTDEADLLKQIKKEFVPKCVSKRKLANKYISKYHKPQLNEAGQTFNCSECDKSFTMRNLLSHHIIYEHNTLQLLKCPICYRRFNKLNGLSNHIRATHKIRRHHICKLCHHSFSRHHYLVYHMRSVHKNDK